MEEKEENLTKLCLMFISRLNLLTYDPGTDRRKEWLASFLIRWIKAGLFYPEKLFENGLLIPQRDKEGKILKYGEVYDKKDGNVYLRYG